MVCGARNKTVDGKGYIKKYDGNYLISLNPDFDDIDLTDKDFRCFGLVLGIAELANEFAE